MSIATDYQYDVVGQALIDKVLPTLAQLIEQTAADLARQVNGDEATIIDRDDAAAAVIKGIADLLILGDNDVDVAYPLITIHQLKDPRYAAAWFEVEDGATITPPTPSGDTLKQATQAALTAIDAGDVDEAITALDKALGEAHWRYSVDHAADEQPAAAPTPRAQSVIVDAREFVPTTEDSVIEAAVMPELNAKLDELAAGLAHGHAPIDAIKETGQVTYDLPAGKAKARRLLLEALVRFLDTDSALEGGELIRILKV